MLTYTFPDSPDSWIGKEDFWFAGDAARKQIDRRLTGCLFNCLLYPMRGRGSLRAPVLPADIGLLVGARSEFGASMGLNLGGGATVSKGYRAHVDEFPFDTLEANAALIRVAGVLEVACNANLMAELCEQREYKGVPAIAPAFAESLGRLILRGEA